MPKVFFSEPDRRLDKAIKDLHGRLLAEGIRNNTVAEWLNCTPQNIGYLWRTKAFTYKQIITIEYEFNRYLNQKY